MRHASAQPHPLQLRMTREMTVEPSSTLPRGKVSFVITDIEGSTTLLRRLGDDFPALVFLTKRYLGALGDRRWP